MASQFPPGFIFGAATAAYQIEGATDEDGRGPSIWDTFTHTPGTVLHGDTGDIACDHYHRVDGDLDSLAALGVSSYRFSVAWPRIIPDGSGDTNHKGLDFYRRIVDGLLQRNIVPMATLYHWDLPQPLQDRGGWTNRDTAHRFADYVDTVVGALGDDVPLWITVNEPFCAAVVGHLQGRHAPGQTDLGAALTAAHHLLLAHGLAVDRIRSLAPAAQVGITLNLSDITPGSPDPGDVAAARRLDGHENRWFLDPVVRGAYPEDMLTWYAQQTPVDFIRPGDLQTISAPTDFLGVNYYETKQVVADPVEPVHHAAVTAFTGPVTAAGLDVRSAGLGRILHRVRADYTPTPVYLTENGAAVHDYPTPDGAVHDPERIAYLQAHFAEAAAAVAAGVDLRGYYVWSLMDSFEWADGYSRRYGLLHVDPYTQARTFKDSAHWYRNLIADNS